MNPVEKPTVLNSVGALVVQKPGRSRVFDMLGIDYCCGGKKTLMEACSTAKLDAHSVLEQVLAADSDKFSDELDWSSASLIEMTDQIEQTHHKYLNRELHRLEVMVRKVAAVHGEHYPWLLEMDGVFAGFVGQMRSHMLKEEQMLFPLIRSLITTSPTPSVYEERPRIASVIRVMEREHEDAGVAMRRLRKLSQGFRAPANACNTFIATLAGLRELESDMHMHIHKENNILFPLAQASEAALRQSLISPCGVFVSEPSNWYG